MRKSSAHDLYELMIIAVFLQNATIRRTVQMTIAATLGRFGTKVQFDLKALFAMWLPFDLEPVTEEYLKGLKIGYRAKFIKRLSSDFAAGKINEADLRKLNSDGAKS